MTRREHYEEAERQYGKRPEFLNGPDIPECLAHVWAWFAELAQCRRSNGFGPEPIGHADIMAWSTLTGRITRPVEVSVLTTLDLEYRAHRAKQAEKKAT